MPKSILIIHTVHNISTLADFFLCLKERGHRLTVRTIDPALARTFRDGGCTAKLIKARTVFGRGWRAVAGVIVLPLLWLYHIFLIWYYKYRRHHEAIVCFHTAGKLILPLPCRVLKMPLIIMRCPDADYSYSPLLEKITAWQRSWTKTIALTAATQRKLSQNGDTAAILLPLGVRFRREQRQENLFSQIAIANKRQLNRKFFSIGTAIELDDRQNLELLFKAAQICLAVIPNLQIVVIGDGPDRKQLQWLAQKMELSTLVWFVGEQRFKGKWFANLDVYAITGRSWHLNDIDSTLHALLAALPVVGPAVETIEEFIKHEQTGLLYRPDNHEELAQTIIRLHQSKRLRMDLSANGQALAKNKYTIGRMADEFEKIL